MNCFNIREIQGILKRKFFTDLVNSNDHHDLLNNTMLGLRYKTNGLNAIDQNMSLFFNHGTTNSSKIKYLSYVHISDNNDNSFFLKLFYGFKSFINLDLLTIYLNNLFLFFKNILLLTSKDLLTSVLNSTLIFNSFTNFKISYMFNMFYLPDFKNVYSSNVNTYESPAKDTIVNFKSDLTATLDPSTDNSFKGTEFTNSFRYLRFFNPIISYDYKSGNYLGI